MSRHEDQEREIKFKQLNTGRTPEQMLMEIENLLRKLDIQIVDAGYKPVPKYMSGPAILMLWIKSKLSLIEASEGARKQFIIEEIVTEFKRTLDKYYEL